MSRTRALWLVPALLALHNVEEAAFFPRYLPLVLSRVPETWRPVVGPITLGQVWVALGVVTLMPFAIAWWATRRPENKAAIWLLLLIQATVLLNVAWHVAAAALLFGGYAPGLATAVAVNLPFSIYLLRRTSREAWVGKGARWALLPAALLLHGPLLSALLLLTERV
jgi:hypothetical protein